jgi:hypothetical protein
LPYVSGIAVYAALPSHVAETPVDEPESVTSAASDLHSPTALFQ